MYRSLLAIGSLACVTLSACQDASRTLAPESPADVSAAWLVRAPAYTISLSKSTVSVQVKSTVQLTATVKSSSGTTVTAAVTWGSANPAIATISSNGLVTGVAPGSTIVGAMANGAQITIPVTVTAATTTPVTSPVTSPTTPPTTPTSAPTSGVTPVVSECSAMKAGWLFCDDFETDRTARYYEYDRANGNFARTTSVGVNGSSGMLAHFAASQTSAGSLKIAFGRTPSSYFRPVDAGTAVYRDIYWRVYVRNQTGWTGGGGDKLSRAQSIAGADWSQAMVAPVWSGGQSTNWNYLLIDPHSGTDENGVLKTVGYNDFAHFRWLNSAQSKTPIFDAAHVGAWYCVEAHARLNDAGQSNGVFELWINGNAEASRTGMNWVGSFSAYGINTVFLENFWNNGSPVAQDRYLDNFVVSTSRIGC